MISSLKTSPFWCAVLRYSYISNPLLLLKVTLQSVCSSFTQEVETLQRSLEEKSRVYDRDLREWRREKQQLELRSASMTDEINALKSAQQRKGSEANTEMNQMKSE